MAYMNNSYFNPYPQYQPQYSNPYMDRINNLQQYQQALQPQQVQAQTPQNTLGGKVVDSIDAVKATDIPMDGNMYYFPQADGASIFGKRWLQNGTTEIITYKPYTAPESVQSSQAADYSSQNTEKSEIGAFSAVTDAFMKRFDDIESRFDKLEKSIKGGRSTVSRSKKEDEE